MNAGQFAEFWRMQGCSVVETESCFWYRVRPMVFLSLPHHRALRPKRGELASVFRKARCAMIRFPMLSSGLPSSNLVGAGVFVCAHPNYGLASLEAKARNQTRRGLERCTIEQVDFGYLARHGESLNAETRVRQGRHLSVKPSQWARYCEAANRTAGFESWGAFVDGRLASFMVLALVEDHCTILHQASASAYLKFYPNNALVFSMTKRKLAAREVGCVSYGLKSIEMTEGLDRFKHNMGFRLRPMAERVLLHPLARRVWIDAARKAIQWMMHRRPGDDFLGKASASLSFAETFSEFDDAPAGREVSGAAGENPAGISKPLQNVSA